MLRGLAHTAQLIEKVPAVFSLPRDPDDAKYVDLAVASKAAFIITRDNDLLSLMTDAEFKSTYPGLTIIAPAAFLAHVRSPLASEHG